MINKSNPSFLLFVIQILLEKQRGATISEDEVFERWKQFRSEYVVRGLKNRRSSTWYY